MTNILNRNNKIHIDLNDEDRYLNKRIDTALSKILDLPRNRIQNYIKDRLVTINDKLVNKNYKIRKNDALDVIIPEKKALKVEPNDAPIKILYEDAEIVVIDKPANLVVHPGAGHESTSVVSAMLHKNITLSNIGAPLRPGIVHRIDKETSGIIVVAKTDKAHFILAKQFFEHTISRRYIGIVYGHIKDRTGTVEMPIKRHKVDRKKFTVDENGKNAKTEYKVIKNLENEDVVMFKLFTGRTHQIRVHMRYLNHPILGDKLYYKKTEKRISRQALHAFYLEFNHPKSNKRVKFYSKLPIDMLKIIEGGK